jgi:hypothetical protein
MNATRTSRSTAEPSGSTFSPVLTPEFLALPQRGPDAIFSLGRSSWYDLERRGLVRLVRIRKPGNRFGKVLIPVASARTALLRLSAQKGVARE